jgi:hypothetical protein
MFYRILAAPPGYPPDQKYAVAAYETLEYSSSVGGIRKPDSTRLVATLEEARGLLPANARRLAFEPQDQFLELWKSAMTEEQWLCCTKPAMMLELLSESTIAVERKLRLFAAACCRRVWHLLDATARTLVEISERLADGEANQAELWSAIWASRGNANLTARTAADNAAVGAWRPAVALLTFLWGHPLDSTSPASSAASALEQAAAERAVAGLLCCVFGPLPFREPRFDPHWQTPTVLSLAQAAYEERIVPDPSGPGWLTLDPVRLLILADALGDAGADVPEIIGHLRSPGPHIRGCWCVDSMRDRS